MPVLIALLAAGCVLAAGAWIMPSRIALGGALAFALMNAAAANLSALFGFHPATYDALIAITLAGCFILWQRAGRPSPHLPGPRTLGFLGVMLLVYLAPALLLPVPLDTDAQGFGYLALAVREGGTLHTLAPFHPEIEYLYSPAFPALAAYVSARLGAGLHEVQMGLGAAFGFWLVWLAYDFGGKVALLMAALGTGLLTAYLDSHYTTLMAFVFALAFVIFVLRWMHSTHRSDALAGAVCLAAVPLTHPDTTLILMIGYVPFLLTVWLASPSPTRRAWAGLAVGMPAGGLVVAAPWLLSLVPLLRSDIASPFETSPHHLGLMFAMNGVLVPLLALGGAALAARRRSPADVWMLTWLVAVVEFGALGVLGRVFPWLEHTLLKYDYPFSIAWHGPVIPFLYFGTLAALRLVRERAARWAHRRAPVALVGAAFFIIAGTALAPALLPATHGRLRFFGAFSSRADVAAMQWLRDHAPPDARILNYPTNHEAEWAPVIAERDAVYYRPQPFFAGTETSQAEQDALRGFWANPADSTWAGVLAAHSIDYVLVPQVVTNPAAQAHMFRWRAPYLVESRSTPAEASYLQLVLDWEGARVYAVRTP